MISMILPQAPWPCCSLCLECSFSKDTHAHWSLLKYYLIRTASSYHPIWKLYPLASLTSVPSFTFYNSYNNLHTIWLSICFCLLKYNVNSMRKRLCLFWTLLHPQHLELCQPLVATQQIYILKYVNEIEAQTVAWRVSNKNWTSWLPVWWYPAWTLVHQEPNLWLWSYRKGTVHTLILRVEYQQFIP